MASGRRGSWKGICLRAAPAARQAWRRNERSGQRHRAWRPRLVGLITANIPGRAIHVHLQEKGQRACACRKERSHARRKPLSQPQISQLQTYTRGTPIPIRSRPALRSSPALLPGPNARLHCLLEAGGVAVPGIRLVQH